MLLDFFSLYQHLPPAELFIGEEFIPQRNNLVMVPPLKQTKPKHKQNKKKSNNIKPQTKTTNTTPNLFSFDPPYVNTGLGSTLKKRQCHCRFEVTLDLSNLSWGRESASCNCWLFAKFFSRFRQGRLRCYPVLA